MRRCPFPQWRVQWGQLYPRQDIGGPITPQRAVRMQRGSHAGMWEDGGGLLRAGCMDRHARWRAQHARRLRGADQRQVKERGELACERKQWGKKRDDWGDGKLAQRSRTGGSKQEWDTSVKPTGGEAEPGRKEEKIFSHLQSSLLSPSIHVIRSRRFLLQTHTDMPTHTHTHTHTLIHAQKHTQSSCFPCLGCRRQSQLGTDFIEANARTSTHGRVKQDEAQKPTSSRLWGRVDHLVSTTVPLFHSPFLFHVDHLLTF